MPGATAIGRLANSPIRMLDRPATITVEKRAPSNGTPPSPSTSGLTTIMYAIVRKVVRPASASTRAFVPSSLSLKVDSNQLFMRGSYELLWSGPGCTALRSRGEGNTYPGDAHAVLTFRPLTA